MVASGCTYMMRDYLGKVWRDHRPVRTAPASSPVSVVALAGLLFLAGCGGRPAAPTHAPAVSPTATSALPRVTATGLPTTSIATSPPTTPKAVSPATTASPLSTATSSPPTITATIAPPTAITGAALYTANFATWFAGEETTPYPSRSRFDPTSGEYDLALTDPARQYGAFRYGNESPRLDDFQLDVDARAIAGPAGGGYGVVFRAVPPGPGEQTVAQQLFFVTTDGRFFLTQIDSAGRGTALAPPTPSEVIRRGDATNHLTVVCRGERITLLINGQTVGTYTGAAATGGFGVGVSNPKNPAGPVGMEAAFRDLRVSTAP